MGSERVDLTVSLNLSDEPTATELQLARDLTTRIKAIADEPQYRDVVLWSIPPDHGIFSIHWDRSALPDEGARRG